ncbi:M1 family aminopeptidase [Idiomarina loihiensis]|uniref:M1 family aminopeptidase n=1 Tax=Idiomarina TaxID=135575 RepID=UPI000C0CFA34|nr:MULTISPECIES: M1 family aminopeptidase [unclassified Idiomarina]MBL4856419.1 hypothetical protein [Idiomarina sp.]PHQ91012.1 MAG: hypothetical protein COB44_04890 [Idiomarina sp.]TDO53776.1 hypothetical protein DEU30_101818 [Idiomarina sp. 017G]
MRIAFLLSILFLLPGAAIAQSPGDFAQYDTSAKFDIESGELKVTTELTIPASALTSNEARLFLNKSFTIADISGEGLKGYSVNPSEKVPPWNEIALAFEESSKTHEITLSYAGVVDNTGGHGNFITEDGIHLSIDSAWHPFYTNFATPMQGELEVKLPSDWKMYGPGTVVQNGNQYRLKSTKGWIDVSFYATSSGSEYNDGSFSVVYDKANEEHARPLAALGSSCQASLNQKYGQEDKLESATLVILDRDGPSFARGNYLSVSSQRLQSKQQSYHYICHELSHNWTAFGDAMSHDYWMMESFAEYVAAQEVKSSFGVEAYEQILAEWKARAKGQSYVWRADTEQRASFKVNYGLGPLMLKKLKDRIGEEKFEQLLHWYMTEPVTETEQLLEHLEQVTSNENEEWFKLLLEGR